MCPFSEPARCPSEFLVRPLAALKFQRTGQQYCGRVCCPHLIEDGLKIEIGKCLYAERLDARIRCDRPVNRIHILWYRDAPALLRENFKNECEPMAYAVANQRHFGPVR